MKPPATQFDDPEYWRRRAEQVRTLADDMSDEASKETMLRIARDYERKAGEAEERLDGSISKAPEHPAGPPVDREAILRKLDETERHVALGKEHIARQREIIADLDREGHDTSAAKELLESYLVTQAAHEEKRRTIIKELGE
jgi:hypothetical protein